MTEPAISVRGLSKQYRLGTINRHTLSDEITYLYHKLLGRDAAEHMGTVRHDSMSLETANIFWALKDVSFDIQAGEIIGIMGGNGAGKSTLLKILSQITEPTEGEAIINGRIGSLLEVGTGFHPELSGRENIYMNGTILGMKRAEINRRFDDIVEFSEIGKFLDTPVKRYSSGMYVRLAFAVAAHLETEILLIDEVLAVGDAKFQKKCIGKMDEAAHAGRTILFVSHNLQAIRTLCPRSILLTKGQSIGPIPTEEALHHYVGFEEGGLHSSWKSAQPVGFASASLTQNGKQTTHVNMSQSFDIAMGLADGVSEDSMHVSLQIVDEQGFVIHHSADLFERELRDRNRCNHRLVTIPAYALAAGRYALSILIWHRNRGILDEVMNALSWDVIADDAIFTQYPPAVWKGVTGPGLLIWHSQSPPFGSDGPERGI